MSRWDLEDRSGLLKTAFVFYGVALAVTAALAWLTDTELAAELRPTLWSLLVGIAAVVPMSLVFVFAHELRDLIVELLGKPLSRCRLLELAVLAVLAGIVEELLFRGVLQTWWSRIDQWVGFIGANVLFGLLHALTPLYCLLATLLGMYLSWLAELDQPRNLVTPIVAHAVYDFLGFMVIARDYRLREKSAGALPDVPV
jgi:membrane protease YdiL (CAAX protease family)